MASFITLLAISIIFTATSAVPLPHVTPSSAARTALAVIHEADGIWGSVVFHQGGRGQPVLISASFNNIRPSLRPSTDWGIFHEPVHYSNAANSRCTTALKGVLRLGKREIGSFTRKHGAIRGRKFSLIAYDYDISLYPDDPGYIVQRSFAIHQGDAAKDHVCATVYATDIAHVLPGAVPCEVVRYADCTVSVGRERCRKRMCEGYRQFWGIKGTDRSGINEGTKFCVQREEVFPEVTAHEVDGDGTFRCELGRHTNLVPLSRD